MTLPTKALTLFDGTRTIVSGFVEMLEGIFTDTVTRLAPILAPLPPAFSVYTAMIKAATPFWVALCTALAVELIGIFSSKVAVRTWNWNRSRLKSEPAAPFRLTVAMAAVYFVVVLVLALSIEIWQESLIILYPGFVIIAAATYVSNAISGDLAAWQRERDERIAQQKEKRGLAAEIKTAIEQLLELKTDLEATRAETAELTEAAKADLETTRAEKHHLAAEITRLKAQRKRLKQPEKAVSPDDPPGFSEETIEQAREVYNRFAAEGRTRFGAALGREVGVNDRNGRKLVEYFRSLNGYLNEEVNTNK